jgi:hypothetical protein
MSITIEITFQKSFNNLPYSSFETIQDAERMFWSDNASPKLDAIREKIKMWGMEGTILRKGVLTPTKNGFILYVTFIDESKWQEGKQFIIDDPVPLNNWTRTVGEQRYTEESYTLPAGAFSGYQTDLPDIP